MGTVPCLNPQRKLQGKYEYFRASTSDFDSPVATCVAVQATAIRPAGPLEPTETSEDK
jgi:hypothetical protein